MYYFEVELKSNVKPAIEISNLKKNFLKSGKLFNGVALDINEGEFITLLGPSGCGKSTLLRMIAGLETYDSGIVINHYLKNQMMVFQDPSLIPWRTALENVLLPFEIGNSNREIKMDKAMNALELVGLTQSAKLFPKELSGGMRMRVSIARALAQNPKLLLLDEPFAALDENTRERLQEDLLLIQDKFKMTIVFVTHSIDEAVFLSDRIVILSRPPAQILFNDQIRLPQKRTSELRNTPEYFYELKRVRSCFPKVESTI